MDDDQPFQGKQVTLDEALAFAIDQHRGGNVTLADDIYGRVLEAVPDHPDALHFRGVARHQMGKTDEAIRLMRRAAELQPGHPDFHVNLGNVLMSVGQCAEALEAYDRALTLQTHNPNAHSNRGVVLRALRRDAEAGKAYRRAIEQDPEHAGAYHNLGNLLNDVGRPAEACEAYRRALSLHEGFSQAFQLLAKTQYRMGEVEQAIETLRQWRSTAPDNPIAQHLLAACEGRDVPARAADAYVRELFDDFSSSFDSVLQRLDYDAPKHIGAAVAEALGEPTRTREVLDAGCGTGLAAPFLREFAGRLVGVDLSPGMLQHARRTGHYDELVERELTAFLNEHPNRFDLIASADTLCYFGDLADVFAAAAGALRPAGLLVFSVESASEEEAPQGHQLHYHGRYAHRRAYVEQQLARAGFAAPRVGEAALRRELGKPVQGFIVAARVGDCPGR